MSIAERINNLTYDFDPYGYIDSYEDFESGVKDVEELLSDDLGRETIIIYLNDVVENTEDDDEMVKEATELIKIIKEMMEGEEEK